MFYGFIFWILSSIYITKAFVPPPCPNEMMQNPLLHDLVLASEHVSWEEGGFQGNLGYYTKMTTVHMDRFDTRMRIYTCKDDAVIVFRPTQQTPHGGSIHADRFVVPTTMFKDSSCNVGSVHNHFQEAFFDMILQANDSIVNLSTKNIYVTGHSLGGSFSLFMAASLVYDYQIIPKGVYGFAGTFVGNQQYRENNQDPLHLLFPMWLIETVDKNNPQNRDGTSEGYQTLDNQLSIDRSMICGFYITPLGPGQSYGMHDLKNYALAV